MVESANLGVLNKRVSELFKQKKYSEATSIALMALDLARTKDNPTDVVTAFDNLAHLQKAQGKYQEAEQYFKEALAVWETLSNGGSVGVMLLHDLARMHIDQLRNKDAEVLLKRAIELAGSLPDVENAEVGDIFDDLGGLFAKQGRHSEEEECHQRALALYEKAGDEARTATTLMHLGWFRHTKGNLRDAETLLTRALRLRGKVFNPEHPAIAEVMNRLGLVYYGQWRLGDAERFFLRALAIRQKAFGHDHPRVAVVLDHLGLVYHALVRFGEAEWAHRAACDIFERVDPKSKDFATALHNLGWLYDEWDRPAKAAELYLKALQIFETQSPSDDLALSDTLHNLAVHEFKRKNLVEAEKTFVRALKIKERLLGSDHIGVARVANNLALLYHDQHRLEEAEVLCKRAITIIEKSLGSNHPSLAKILTVLAAIYRETERAQDARTILEQALQLREPMIANVFAFASEREKLNFSIEILPDYFQFMTLVCQEFSKDQDALRAAFKFVLRLKGIVLEALIKERRLVARSDDPEVRNMYEQLQQTSSELAKLRLNGPETSAIAGYEQRIAVLEATKTVLEKRLSSVRGAHAFSGTESMLEVAEVVRCLPKGTALIEYVIVPRMKLRGSSHDLHLGPERYLAFVLTSSGTSSSGATEHLALVDLGDASVIDQAIWRFRQEIAAFGSQFHNQCGDMGHKEWQLATYSRKLYELVFAPLKPEIGNSRMLFISPDGELNQVPLGAIQDGAQRYLIESYQLNYLSSGRDLVRFGEKQKNSGDTVVIADPDYDMCTFGGMLERLSRVGKNRSDERLSQLQALALIHWRRLRGTREEADAIKQLFPGYSTKLFTGRKANKQTIRSLVSPKRLHIATHGFFLGDIATANAVPASSAGTTGGQAAGRIEDPLLRSGLVLAGANQRRKKVSPDGILTAFEAASLRLFGTEIAVLSACETGVGQSRIGEGVFGLRRAFELAGAKTVVISLWAVADQETRKLMVNFYGRIKGGQNKGSALRDAQLDFVNNQTLRHPYFWGAFVSVGEP